MAKEIKEYGYRLDGSFITRYPVVSTTAHTVTFRDERDCEVRERMKSAYHSWHATREDAEAYRKELNDREIAIFQKRIERLQADSIYREVTPKKPDPSERILLD